MLRGLPMTVARSSWGRCSSACRGRRSTGIRLLLRLLRLEPWDWLWSGGWRSTSRRSWSPTRGRPWLPGAARVYGDPTAELDVVGITGTNGKTTTAFLIREILEAAGTRCGLLGTVKQVVGGVEEEVERTTPEAIDLQGTFRRMVDGGDRACAMEVSSHALVLHRCDAIHFDVALFSNLTQDHLDFHGDMEDYFRSKRLLFEMGPEVSVVNVDDPYGRRLADEFECITLSIEGREADFVAGDISMSRTGAKFTAPWRPTGRKPLPTTGVRPLRRGGRA